MNALLLRNLQMRRAASLQSFREYRALEAQNPQQSSVTSDGALLEFETLELRLHPPNVVIDNDSYDDMTVITIDSANRPGTLIEVVQCLTELNLSIRKARISSDGGWFVDEFFVTETPKGKVMHPHKLDLIRKVLSVGTDSSFSNSEPVAVFELSGRDRKGLLAAVLSTLTGSGCDIQSVAVWTYHNKVALVVAVADRTLTSLTSTSSSGRHSLLTAGGPSLGSTSMLQSAGGSTARFPGCAEPDPARMEQIVQVLSNLLGGEGAAHVAWEVVQGDIHHERRLHHLLLQEEDRAWEAQNLYGMSSLVSHLSGTTDLNGSGNYSAQLQGQNSFKGGGGGGGGSTAHTPPPPSPQPTAITGASIWPASSGMATQPAVSTISAANQPPTFTWPSSPVHQAKSQPASQHTSMSGAAPPSAANGADHGEATGSGGGADAGGFSEAGGESEVSVLQSSGGTPLPPPASSFVTIQQGGSEVNSVGGAKFLEDLVGSTGPDAFQEGRQLQRHYSSIGGSSVGGGAPPAPLMPAPTAMLPSDLLNMHAYMDPSGVAHMLRADVRIQHSPLLKYYLVTITCKDRNKLFFDTVCTLADMQYDVYHGAIDSEGDQASQLFYVRPRSGELVLDDMRLRQLSYMLECAVQRRFPKGLRMHMQTTDRTAVPTIFSALSNAGLSVTRAEVRSLADGRTIFDLTVTDTSGQLPSPSVVQRACEAAEGVQADELAHHPLMEVVGVGGAAAAAATAITRAGLGQSHLLPASGGPAGLRIHSTPTLPPTGLHTPAHQPQRAAGGQQMPVPARQLPGRFQFAISGSADRRGRGPLGQVAGPN